MHGLIFALVASWEGSENSVVFTRPSTRQGAIGCNNLTKTYAIEGRRPYFTGRTIWRAASRDVDDTE